MRIEEWQLYPVTLVIFVGVTLSRNGDGRMYLENGRLESRRMTEMARRLQIFSTRRSFVG